MMKNILMVLSLITLFSTSAVADKLDPADMFEYMKKALKGEWKLSPEDK